MTSTDEKPIRLSDAVRALVKVAGAYTGVSITDVCPAQIRGARAMLDLTQEDLAKMSGVSIMAVKDLESGKRKTRTKTLSMVVKALEGEGITFLEQGIIFRRGS
jgi:predicted transcriptional regulator